MELDKKGRFATWLHKFQKLCASSNKKNLKDILPVIAKGIGRFIDAETTGVFIIEGEKLEFFTAYGRQAKSISDISLKNEIFTWIMKKERPLSIDNSRKNKQIIRGLPVNIKIDSFVGAPMSCKKGMMGMLFAFNKKKGLFTKDDADSLSIFSTILSPFIDNIRLNEKQKQIQKKLSALQSIIDTTLSNQDIESLLYAIIQKIVHEMEANAGGIYLLNESNNITFKTSYNIPAEVLEQYEEKIKEMTKQALNNDGAAACYAKGEPLIMSQYIKSYQVMSILCAPLKVNKRMIGLIHIDTLTPHIFSPCEINLLEMLSERIALAIENNRLFTALNDEVGTSSTLLQTAELVNNNNSIEQLLKRIVHIIPWLFNSDWCCTYLWMEKERAFLPVETSLNSKPLIEGFKKMIITPGSFLLADKIFEAKNPIVIEDAANSELIPQDHIRLFNIKSLLVAPFVSREAIMGFMTIIFSQAKHHFTTREVVIAKGLANQVAVVIENMKLNEDVKESEERYRTLVENATDAITSIDLDGVVINWNKAAEGLYGYTKEEVMGKKIPVVPEDRAFELPMFSKNVIMGNTISNFETKRRHKDGHLIDISLAISPVKNEEGEIIGFSGIARDITEKKQLEEKRIQLEKEAAVVELAGAAAHEINQPLTSVIARTDLLMMNTPKEDPLYRSLKVISDDAKRMAALVQKIGQITSYKSKPYIGKDRIIDIEGATKDDTE
ncbi:MAG: PAS domain S-box protein [Nitrospirae bacterium]|nr:PAS domain S-box protein [Nitrospirota bacterium]